MNGIVTGNMSLCRLCGTSEGIKFKIFDPGRDYISKIHQLLPIMIHQNDSFPKLICHRCAFKLQEFYEFRETCIQTDVKLKRGVGEPQHKSSPPQLSQQQQKKPQQQQQEKQLQQQQKQQHSWTPGSANSSSVPNQAPAVKIKQEAPDEQAQPPVLSPHHPIMHQSPVVRPHNLMQQGGMMQQPASLMQQPGSLMQQQLMHPSQLMQHQLMSQQQLMAHPHLQQHLMTQQQLMSQSPQLLSQQQAQLQLLSQQHFMSQMPMMAQPMAPAPHLMMQGQPPTSSPQQATQLQPMPQMPMVQFNQENVVVSPTSENVYVKLKPNSKANTPTPQTNASQQNMASADSKKSGSLFSESTDRGGSSSDGDRDAGNDGNIVGNEEDPLNLDKRTNKRKHSEDSSASSKKKKSSKSRSRSRSSKSRSKASENSVVPNTERASRSKPGPKPKTSSEPQSKVTGKPVEPQSKSVSRSRTPNRSATPSRSIKIEAEEKKTEPKKPRKPGPKSKVGVNASDTDDSEVSIVCYKPPGSVLDTIDMTQEPDTPNESEDEGDPSEGLPPHVLATKIPGMGNIFTCTLCESTITSKKHVFTHVCPKKDTLGEPCSVSSENSESSTDAVILENKKAKELPNSESENKKSVPESKEADDQGEDGSYKCDVCNMSFTRQVTLQTHKERHLYSMAGDDSDSRDSDDITNKKKKKPVPLPAVEGE